MEKFLLKKIFSKIEYSLWIFIKIKQQVALIILYIKYYVLTFLYLFCILENDYKARLIAAVKKEVKQVMEESVTKKFVHEESGSVTSLCGAVEACLSQGK